MATVVMLKNPRTGIIKKGFFGFSWTIFFFSGFPYLFRGDLVMGLVMIVIQWFTFGFGTLIWAFLANKSYTTKLIEQGYELADSEGINALARARLGISQPTLATT
jgi:hypothetical protein